MKTIITAAAMTLIASSAMAYGENAWLSTACWWQWL